MHVLTPKETGALLSALRAGEEGALEATRQALKEHFPGEGDRFRSCCALVLLLQDYVLVARAQRVAALFALLDAYRSAPPVSHPFLPFLVGFCGGGAGDEAEKDLVAGVLVGERSLGDVSARSGAEFIATWRPHDATVPTREERLMDLIQRQRAVGGNADTSVFRRAAIHRAVLDAGGAPALGGPSGGVERRPDLSAYACGVGVAGFEPTFVRPQPPLMAPIDSEIQWIEPWPSQGLVWDGSAGADSSGLRVVSDLIQRALEGPLLPWQQKQVLQELMNEPKLAYCCGLTPESLPQLVENTPAIAYEILLRLMNSNLIGDYLQVLVKMSMSLHSMEVVNRLTTAVNIPEEFVHCYISNCIASCNQVEDRYMQSRLVRLVCVFLQSLIKNRIINVQDLVHELQAFCIDFSRIREAASLFRLLKQMELDNWGEGSSNDVGDGSPRQKGG
ncbi:unnamed protein product [Ostreobium quekettii]|uniref:CCR4-NOT transcription complex subunit 11 n=1 Tax=Ostreobium quekettii TaxID=121088 RepID=A0A8S1IWX6_9CHLO|nr:unnamed protein product [Ostreobium quekettii]